MSETDPFRTLASRYFQLIGFTVLDDGNLMNIMDASGGGLILSTDPTAGGEENPQVQFLGPGSMVMERIIRDLRGRGKVTRQYARHAFNEREAQGELRQWLLADNPGANIAFSHTHCEFVPLAVLNVKLAYVTDEKREELMSLGVDLESGKLYSNCMSALTGLVMLPNPPLAGVSRRRMPLKKAYAQMMEWLGDHAKMSDGKWAREATDRLQAELEQLEKYYGSLDIQRRHQDQDSECNEGAEKSRPNPLQDKERRMEEQRNKFSPRVVVEYINSGLFYIPHLRFNASIRDAYGYKEYKVDFDALTGEREMKRVEGKVWH